MKKKKIMLTMGIRPDGNKISPLYKKFLEYNTYFDTVLVNTGQHGDLLGEMLTLFDVEPDYDMKIMKPGQSIFDISIKMLDGLDKIIRKEKPDIVFSPNDGTTSLVTAIAAYFHKIPVAHVEAGLRTYDIYNPFPEEGNRKMTSAVTSYHFAPTPQAKENLIKESFDKDSIFTTGNTVIDSLYWVVDKYKDYVFSQDVLNNIDYENKKVIILTTHRRENWGKPMEDALTAIKRIVEENQDVEIVFPVHPNPIVQDIAQKILGSTERIHMIEPLSYVPFVILQSKCYLIISDSGGIQEEAPSFGKPILVMRKTTERPEGVEAGVAKLVGTNKKLIYEEATRLLKDEKAYKSMSTINNPYGDGRASERIVKRMAYIFNFIKGSPGEFKNS